MKKLFLLGSLLFGSLLFANNLDINNSINKKIVYSPDGICSVFIYDDSGNLLSSSTSFQPNEAACNSWAAGKIWTFIASYNPAS